MKRGKFNIVIGAQAGSEAKGKLSAYIAEYFQPEALFMAASPNAGHTVVLGDKKLVTYHLPAAAITTSCPIFLGPTSLINAPIFLKELEATGIDPSRVNIDARALVIPEKAIEAEGEHGFSDFGSTLQGIGQVRIWKLLRAKGPRIPPAKLDPQLLSVPGLNLNVDTCLDVNTIMDWGGTVLAEQTQGFDLCLEHGIDPRYCTSKFINPAAYMAEAGVSPYRVGDIYGVLRPFPIRVNNRTGTSGPYHGAEEITWQDVAQECGFPGDPQEFGEITTTTHLPRRVFTFSWERLERFATICRPNYLCLQFANYLQWSDYGVKDWDMLSEKTRAFVGELERVARCPVDYVGTGPDHSQMVCRSEDVKASSMVNVSASVAGSLGPLAGPGGYWRG